MTDTLWSDISEWQVPVNDQYPYEFLCIRSNDGSYLDKNFPANYSWCKASRASGKLWGFMIYYFYRPGVDGASVLMSRCGSPDPRMVVMIDMESDGGRVTGNQSGPANAQHDALAKWLGDPRRVVGYGNVIDLDNLWPNKPSGMRIVVAAYGSNPPYPGKYAHQFTSSANVVPFGPSDLNSADDMSRSDLETMYGFKTAKPAPGYEDDPMICAFTNTVSSNQEAWEVNPAGNLWHRWWVPATGWSTPVNRGGGYIGSPSFAVNSAGTMCVFVQKQSGAPDCWSFTGNAWSKVTI